MSGVKKFSTADFVFYDVSESDNVYKNISILKESNAVCKKENGVFYWYLKKDNSKPETAVELCINNFKGNLFNYQKTDSEYLSKLNRAILAHETGLGKTIISLAALNHLYETKDRKDTKSLVVVPNVALIDNWIDEIKNHTDFTYSVYPDLSGKLVLTTYTRLRIDKDYFSSQYYFCIIFDEANAIKNSKASQTKASYMLKAHYKWLLTATPIKNSPLEIYSLCKALDCSTYLFGSYYSYLQEYAEKNFVGFLNRDVIVGYKNLDGLRKKIKPMLLVRTKDSPEVVKQIGKEFEYIKKVINVPLDSQQRKLIEVVKSRINEIMNEIHLAGYNEDEWANSPELKRYKEKMLPYYTIARTISNSIHLYLTSENNVKNELPSASKSSVVSNKVAEIIRIINDEVGNDKIVIFTSFEKFANEIDFELNRKNIKSLLATGKTDYAEVLKEFKESKDKNVLVLTNVGKYGLNLQFAKYLIICEPPFTYSDMIQIEGRIVRTGQQAIPVIYFLLSGEIDENIYNKMLEKKHYNIQILSE